MENAEEIFQALDDFAKRVPKAIPRELEEYLAHVARTGDPVYQWNVVKCLFKEKLINVISDFYETSPGLDIPPCPNVDPFNYDSMKNSLIERIESFSSAPFTVQRICELLTSPRKQYNRIDKFMRAIEKNILVVSTREPGPQRHIEQENGEQGEPMVNGSDNNSDYNVDIVMEDIMFWKENIRAQQSAQPQPGSSEGHITVDNIQARLQAKDNIETKEKVLTNQYEPVTPPELNTSPEENVSEIKESDDSDPVNESLHVVEDNMTTETVKEPKESSPIQPIIELSHNTDLKDIALVTENKDAEMTELKEVNEVEKETIKGDDIYQSDPVNENIDTAVDKNKLGEWDKDSESETPINDNVIQPTSDDSNEETIIKETYSNETKHIPELLTSSEESSSSSDNTDGNSNSPKTDNETHIDIQEESNHSEVTSEDDNDTKLSDTVPVEEKPILSPKDEEKEIFISETSVKSSDYSISDVNSELPQPSVEEHKETAQPLEEVKSVIIETKTITDEPSKPEETVETLQDEKKS